MRVFISYRHVDGVYAGRLRDRLADDFGEGNVFLDVESIDPGQDFWEVIRATIEVVDAVLVVIGPGFDLDRLADEDDLLRREVTEALRLHKKVVPILVGASPMPESKRLPEDIRALVSVQAARLRLDPDFRSDTTRLIDALRAGGMVPVSTPGGHRTVWVAVARTFRRPVAIVATAVLVALVGVVVWWRPDGRSPEEQYQAATRSAPVIDDTMKTNEAGHRWSEDTTIFGECRFEQGAYHVLPVANAHRCCRSDVYLDDLAVEATVTIEDGDEGGIGFRWDDSSGYFFHITASGYVLFTYDRPTDRVETLLRGSAPVEPTGPNLVAVLARGPTIDLYVNEEYVATIEDTTFRTGAVVLCARDILGGTNVAFRDVQAWSVTS